MTGNTPFASLTNGIFFENYLSAGSSTVPSLTNTLAKRHKNEPQLHNNLINLAKKAGFYTYWVSNQHYLGEWDTPISIIAKQANSSLFIKVIDPVKFNDVTDEALLPFIKQCLTEKTTQKNKLIVVHLIGSHPACCKRSNGKFDTYFHSKEVSCYIQSIRNTDKLLQDITKIAKKANNSWSMMYFSDHGLALKNGKLCHQEKYQEIFRVPMFMVSSDSDKKQQIIAYRSAFNFPYLFSQWTGIQEKSLTTSLNYLSNEECEEQSYIILSDRGKTDIRLLPNNIIE
ncbi:MAG: phosphoethanolamine transferase (plasmid) [Candidatus Symbiodolus clandestinus]